jgi:hypothetical protein
MNSVRGLLLGAAVVTGGLGLAAGAGVANPAQPAVRADGPDMQRLMDAVAPKLVTVKFILKMEMGGQMGDMGMEGEETEQEISGVLIDAKGLVLTSSAQLGGFADMFGGAEMGITATPKDMKVLIGDDTEGVKAEVVARDRELDLAWVRITETTDAAGAAKSFDALDLSKPGAAKVGDKIYIVEKLGKFFDRAPIVVEERVAGTTKKPRPLIVPMGMLAASMGKPVFTADGSLLGMVVVQMPGADEMAAAASGMGDHDVRGFGMILPASEISKATERALATAASGEKPGEAKPATPGAAAAPKPEPQQPGEKK